MANSIIKYALDNLTEKSIYIDNASNGLSCNCHCAKCKTKMVAVQGRSENHREWHFRHYIDSDCLGGQETAIHKLAKQIIVDSNEITIPGDKLFYSNARQEEPLFKIIPDVTVFSNGQHIYIEIAVTHPIGYLKEETYIKGQYKSIEIDLKNISYDTTPSEFENIILHKVDNKRKIYWEAKEFKQSISNKEKIVWKRLIPFFIFLLGILFISNLRKKRTNS